ncbi:hypothetical protein MTO96_007064 [Rhipicephalus appendiculatus]
MNDKAVATSGNNISVARLGFAPYRAMLSMISEIQEKLKEGESLGFPYLIRGDISDGQRMGLPPITFLRQVVSLCALPEIASHVPSDVVQRARDIIKHCPGGAIGAIQNQNHPLIHQHIAEHISQRDSVEARPEDIWATDGVTHGFTVCYYLDEDCGWAHNIDEMQKALDESKSVCVPRCLLLVNPANPPSTVLSRKQLEDIIMFAHKNHLIILADEIFEYNTYDSNFPFPQRQEGYEHHERPIFTDGAGFLQFDIKGIHCRAALDCIVRPPELGDPSYELFIKEKTSTLNSLARRAKMAEKRLNAIPGFHCGPVHGSMAAYARINIPAKAIEEAERHNKQADVFYAEELLKAKGISVTPSSAFGRLPGRYHIRKLQLHDNNDALYARPWSHWRNSDSSEQIK